MCETSYFINKKCKAWTDQSRVKKNTGTSISLDYVNGHDTTLAPHHQKSMELVMDR